MSHGRHTTPKELQLTHRGQLECSLQSIGAGYSAGVTIVEMRVRFLRALLWLALIISAHFRKR